MSDMIDTFAFKLLYFLRSMDLLGDIYKTIGCQKATEMLSMIYSQWIC